MAIVVGYFDTDDAATRALDTLMQTPGYEDTETRVFSNDASDPSTPGGVIGGLPNTSGGVGNNMVAPIPATGWRGSDDWLDELGSDERRYFTGAMSSGTRGVLVMARVDEDEADQVRQLFSRLGARTYQE